MIFIRMPKDLDFRQHWLLGYVLQKLNAYDSFMFFLWWKLLIVSQLFKIRLFWNL